LNALSRTAERLFLAVGTPLAFELTRVDNVSDLKGTQPLPPEERFLEVTDAGFQPRLPPAKGLELVPHPLSRLFPRRPDQPHPVDGQPSFPREGCPIFLWPRDFSMRRVRSCATVKTRRANNAGGLLTTVSPRDINTLHSGI